VNRRIVETVTSGPGVMPKTLVPQALWTTRTNIGPRDVFSNEAGMLTVCAHGLILREGWASMSLEVSGQELVLLVKKYCPAAVRYSSIPAHCEDCAKPTDGIPS
jgi:hypothetical protein